MVQLLYSVNKPLRALPALLLLITLSCNTKPVNNNEKSAVKDPHSFGNPEEVAVKHIDLDLDVNFEKHVISGSATLTLENKTGSTGLMLDSRDLNITNILLDNGEEAKFSLGKEVKYLGQPLTVKITPGTKNVTIFYSTSSNAAALQWVESPGRAPFLFTQSQAVLARSWVPCQDGPGVKFTYTAKVRVPSNLMALMSAENDTVKHADGVYTFNMPQPVSSYLLALAAGDFRFRSLGTNCGVYAEADMIARAASEFTDMEKMIAKAESLYGPYRWGRYDVIVLPASFPFGGMENPRLTFATPTIISGDKSLVALIAHELAHSWSGNLVTNATWNDFWLNEGFTVYFENRIMEAMYGKDYADMLEYLGYGELERTLAEMGATSPETHLFQDTEGKDPDDGVNDIAYEKGRFFLRTIEEAAGRERFDAFLKTYFNANAFGSMDTKTFLEYLHANLIKGDKELEKKINIDAWVYGPGIPANVPPVKAIMFDEVDAATKDWKSGTKNAAQIAGEVLKKWNTHQWLHFLRNLPDTLSAAQMSSLDKAFGFTESGNSEILCDWFRHCVKHQYMPAYPAMENYLVTVGRRKFIVPLYDLLLDTPGGKTFALRVYKKARPGYHPLTQETIEDLIKEKS